MEYFKENQIPGNISDEMAGQIGDHLEEQEENDINEVDVLMGAETPDDDDENDGRIALSYKDYMGMQIEIISSEENMRKASEALGRDISEITEEDAAKYYAENEAVHFAKTYKIERKRAA